MSRPIAAVTRHEANLRQLELAITRRLDGILHGDHLAADLGAGSDPEDSRVYRPGDDARRIDWNLTARSGEVHVRTTTAERELDTWLVVDASASLDFGTATWEKRDLALVAAAAFALLGSGAGNRTGAVIFDGMDERVIPPRPGRNAAMAVLRTIDRHQPVAAHDAGGQALAPALRRARGLARRRGRMVVISDLIDTGPWSDQLRAIGIRHDLVVAQVSDPREWTLPAVGLLTMVDPETGRRTEVQTSDRRLQTRFAAAADAQRRHIAAQVHTSRARHLHLSTDGDWLIDIARFVGRSARRSGADRARRREAS